MRMIVGFTWSVLMVSYLSTAARADETIKFTAEANSTYKVAMEKIKNVHDNDPYAMERFKYTADKIRDRLDMCHDDACITDANHDLLNI